jgi:hypothetical protein
MTERRWIIVMSCGGGGGVCGVGLELVKFAARQAVILAREVTQGRVEHFPA